MKIMITGISGQVGRRLLERLAPEHELIGMDRQRLDLADRSQIESVIDMHEPDLIINPAAFTAVDRAESEPEIAARINTVAPAVLGEQAKTRNIPVIHFSTDYVFDGQKHSAYVETDLPCPLNAYGRTKREGEITLLNTGATALILRTSWVFDAIGQNFLTTMLRLACSRNRLQVVFDQLGAPTSARALADAVAEMIRHPTFLEDPGQCRGIYHATASGCTTWHAYACYLIGEARKLGWPIQVPDDAIEPVTTEAFPTVARRPRNSQLNTDKLQNQFQIKLPTWTALVDAELNALRPPR